MNEHYFIEAGKEYCSTGEYDMAEELLRKAVEANPGSVPAWFELGKCRFMAGKHPEAAEAFEKACGLDPNNTFAWLLFGKSLKMQSDFEKAKEVLLKAQALEAGNAEINNELADVAASLERVSGKDRRETPEHIPGAVVPAPAPEPEKTAPSPFPVGTKGPRKDFPPHRVCITWLLTNSCNYRCSYCQNDFKEPEGFSVKTPEEWAAAWKRFYDDYGTAAIQLTGGEPTTYPRFFEILREVAKMHHVEMQTNLSWDPEDLIKAVSPDRVSRIGASFHQDHEKFDVFLAKMKRLKDAGFKVEITYVAYPPYIEKGKELLSQAREAGVPFSVLSFQGEYKGKRYPESYSREEIDRLAELNHFIGNYAQAMANWDVEHKVVVEKNEEKPEISRRCRMGQMYGWMLPNGETRRCCKSPVILGNILDGGLKLLEDARECKLEHCICWRSMVLGEEERWSSRWPGTKDRAQD